MSDELDFNMNFATVAERLPGEREARLKLAERALPFGVSFLDDCCRAILPHDLIMVGAKTGTGKTALVSLIAQSNAANGKRVHYFALEAEPLEIERRLKFRLLAYQVWRHRISGCERLNYPDWYLGLCEDVVRAYEPEVDRTIAERFQTLTTYYRGKEFTLLDLSRLFLAIQDQTDLIILDHLHYIDSEDPNENRANKAIVKAIRDISLGIGVPIIVVAHLRKRERRQTLVPELEDFHGSSDITKIATRAIILAPARGDQASPQSGVANTYMAVVKDRTAGVTNTTAVIGYDLQSGYYEPTYLIGKMDLSGETWTRTDNDRIPRWAGSAIRLGE